VPVTPTFGRRRRVVGRLVQRPVVGQVARYEGTYRPHWEIGHIRVRVSRARRLVVGAAVVLAALAGWAVGLVGPLGLVPLGGLAVGLAALPAVEWWSADFPPGFEGGWDGPGGPIVFDGVVTGRGRYGHMGMMQRKVEISRVVRYALAEPSPAPDTGRRNG
jgi:hypothetical protein